MVFRLAGNTKMQLEALVMVWFIYSGLEDYSCEVKAFVLNKRMQGRNGIGNGYSL